MQIGLSKKFEVDALKTRKVTICETLLLMEGLTDAELALQGTQYVHDTMWKRASLADRMLEPKIHM